MPVDARRVSRGHSREDPAFRTSGSGRFLQERREWTVLLLHSGLVTSRRNVKKRLPIRPRFTPEVPGSFIPSSEFPRLRPANPKRPYGRHSAGILADGAEVLVGYGKTVALQTSV